MTIASVLSAALLTAATAPSSIALPGAAGGIGFDDLRFSAELHQVLVPAGRSGRLDLVDPETSAVRSIEGFGSSASPTRGHEDGTTSADAGRGVVFAIDRTERVLAVVDPVAGRIVARTRLAAGPDYVRWVDALREVWVTEPARKQIETFRLEPGTPPRLAPAGTIAVAGGPESLEVDGARAYTNTFEDRTFAIDARRHAVVERWRNGCRGARGLALDRDRGLLFVGCEEGRAVALDAVHGGKVVGQAKTGRGVDGIAYGARLGHLYVPAGDDATLSVIAVGARGALRELGTMPTAPGAHCATADDRGVVYVCDPARGRVLVARDPYPASP